MTNGNARPTVWLTRDQKEWSTRITVGHTVHAISAVVQAVPVGTQGFSKVIPPALRAGSSKEKQTE